MLTEADVVEEIKSKSRLNHAEAAAYIGISPQTLYNWNHKGRGPRRSVNVVGENEYLRSDLDAFKALKRRVVAAGVK